MDRKITIHSRTVSIDAWGDQAETWDAGTTVWAMYTPKKVSGQNLTELARQEQFLESADFTIRYRTVNSEDRIMYNGAVWKIVSMREEGRQDRLVLTAYRTDSNLFD